MDTFDPLDPEEIVPATFDFSQLASEILVNATSPIVVVSRHSGATDDRDLTTMLVGSAQVVGLRVLQKIRTPVNGVNYKLRCRVDTPEGYRYAEAVLLPGETK